MTVHRNAELIEDLSGDFPYRGDAGFAWGNAVAIMQALPGLCGLWPITQNNVGFVVDASGQGQTLNNYGGVGMTFTMDGFAPYGHFNGTTGYLVLSPTVITHDHTGDVGDGGTLSTGATIVTSLLTNQTQDDITGTTDYTDCAGTASITVAVTSTIVIDAKFKLRTSNADHQAACKLVDAADTNVGTVIAFTQNTVYQDWVIKARITGQAADTYTYNLMGNIANATSHCYIDEKQISIFAHSE